MTLPAPTPNPDPESPSSTGASGGLRRERRALAWGVGISIAVHVVLVALYPAIMDRIDPGPTMVELPDRDRLEPSMEVVLLLETDPPEETEPEEEEAPAPELPPDPEPADELLPDPEAEPTPAPAEDALPELSPEELAEEEEEVRRHIAERLQPQTPDPRLWAFGDAEYMELSDEERAQLMIYGMMQDWNDSVAVAAALSDRATDWTYTDDDGRRWGLSPGRIHLGDFSVPLPFTFDTPPGIRDRVNRDRWIADDIARGAASQAIRQTWAERAREIRRRMDEERERERSGGGG